VLLARSAEELQQIMRYGTVGLLLQQRQIGYRGAGHRPGQGGLGGKPITVSDHYQYLGVEINNTLKRDHKRTTMI